MKTAKKALVAAALAGLMLSLPMAAHAQWCPGQRWEIHHDWRDVAHDRWQLNRDLAFGHYRAAWAQRADIRHDLWDIHHDRGGYVPPFGY